MSSIFDLNERVRRLRETFSYFTNAARLTGAEIRDSSQMRNDEQVHAEWARLVCELRECLEAAEAVAPREGEPAGAPPAGIAATALCDIAELFDPGATRH